MGKRGKKAKKIDRKRKTKVYHRERRRLKFTSSIMPTLTSDEADVFGRHVPKLECIAPTSLVFFKPTSNNVSKKGWVRNVDDVDSVVSFADIHFDDDEIREMQLKETKND